LGFIDVIAEAGTEQVGKNGTGKLAIKTPETSAGNGNIHEACQATDNSKSTGCQL
jgi:hypothetical protein